MRERRHHPRCAWPSQALGRGNETDFADFIPEARVHEHFGRHQGVADGEIGGDALEKVDRWIA